MLGAIEIMGIGLLGWYIMSVVGSFCVAMAGNSYLKNFGVVSKNFNFYPATVFISLIPFFNVIFALRAFVTGRMASKSPEYVGELKTQFEETEKIIKNNIDELMKMSRDNEEDKDDTPEDKV